MAENRRTDESKGHRQTDPAPPFPAPRVPEPLSTSTPENISENISEKNSASTKCKRGRKPGSPKVPGSGRKKPGPEPSGREARKYLEQNSGYLDLLCRMLRGKPIKRQGPTGKLVWYHPDFDDQKWALAQVLPRMIPTLASQELTGDKDNPLAFKDAGEPMDAIELARRTAFLLDAGARETDAARSPDSASRGVTAQAAGVVASPSAAAPAPDIPEGEEASQAAPELPAEPNVGEVATVGGYAIHCKENSRDNLPDLFEIFDDHGRQIRYPINGFQNALRKIRETAGNGADMTVTITKPRPAFSQSRPDQRAERTVDVPAVVGSYAHRKRN